MNNIIAFFDRNYNRLFNKDKVVKVDFGQKSPFKYNDIILGVDYTNLRCLGKDWFKIM